jgi:hypothetical protein
MKITWGSAKNNFTDFVLIDQKMRHEGLEPSTR